MKRFIAILSIFLFLSFNINSITATAETKSFSQGLYKVKDSGLTTNVVYKVKNLSPYYQSVVMIFDGKNIMQEFLRLDPNSSEFFVKPLDFDNIIIIVGNGQIQFS
jgi:hypothetical protein